MGHLREYLDEFSAISLDACPLNCADIMLLCQLAYVDFSPLPPEGASLCAAAAFIPDDPENVSRALLSPAAASVRLGKLMVTHYVQHTDPRADLQFAAVTFLLPDGRILIAYRGTDATLVGWKEDLYLSLSPVVPAQREAVSYLEESARRHPISDLLVAGHSKGGNLAIYAGSFVGAGVRARISDIYNFDGPGQQSSTINSAGYGAIADRIHTYLPQSSIIGMLLEHPEDYTLVRSSAHSIFQHRLYSWLIADGQPVPADRRAKSSLFLDASFRRLLANMTDDERKASIDALFDVLCADGRIEPTDKITDTKNIPLVARSMVRMDPAVRRQVFRFARLIIRAALASRQALIQDPEQKPPAGEND